MLIFILSTKNNYFIISMHENEKEDPVISNGLFFNHNTNFKSVLLLYCKNKETTEINAL